MQKLIFPLETRKKMVCPLFDLPHLNIRLENKIPSIVPLIEGLLWLAPHPKTISITVASKVLATFKVRNLFLPLFWCFFINNFYKLN